MHTQEKFNGLDLDQPKNIFKIILKDEVTGAIVSEQEFENTVGTLHQQMHTQNYKKWATPSLIVGTFDKYIGLVGGDVNLALLADTYGLSADNAYSNLFKYDSVGNLLPVSTNQDNNPRVVAFNYQNSLSNSGTRGGIFIPSLSGLQPFRAYKWVYEWGTTQGNGTIKALGYVPSGPGQTTGSFSMLIVGQVPAMSTTSAYTFAGFKTSGLDKHMYFVTRQSTSNNVVVLKAADRSLVAQKSITNPTPSWSASQKDIIYTPVGGGQFYKIVSLQTSTPGFTFQKAAEGTSMTFGGDIAVTTSFPSGWNVLNVNSWCADESFIYAFVYNINNTETGILKFDPSTDTIVSITKNPSGFGGVGSGVGDSQLFNICPNTGKLFTIWNGNILVEWPSITTPDQMIVIGRWADNEYLNTSSWKTFLYYETADNLVGAYAVAVGDSSFFGDFFEFARGNYFTYAELPAPITKTNTQSLRVEYTLSY